MKKKIGMIGLSFLLVFSFVSCGQKEMKRYDFDLAEYVDVGQIDPIHASYPETGVCTEEEIDQAVFQIMLGYSAYEKKAEGAAEEYDRVEVAYDILYEGEPLEEYADSNYFILIGYESGGDIDYLLGKALIGKGVGETATISYTFPKSDTSLGSWAGKTVEARGTVIAVYDAYPPECTDEFVQSLESFDFVTVQDFRDQLKEDILEQKVEGKKEAVKNAFLSGIQVKKYPEAELQAYIDRFTQELVAAAKEMDLSYGEYIKQYFDVTEDEMNEMAVNDAKERVKNDLACIQTSRLIGTTLTKKEYKEGLARYFEEVGQDFETIKDFEAYYTYDFMYESICWDKTFDYLVEHAVNTAK